MAHDRITYETLVQDALRHVIRSVLAEVAKTGLPGEHHFFITFQTGGEGVGISPRLKERYPEQMTIVLQHQFWDLQVEETYFTVTLSFGDIPEKLVIPFNTIQVFYDPAAAFEAAFDVPGNDAEDKDSSGTLAEDAEQAETLRSVAGGGTQGADVVSLDAFRKSR